jgi:hypothetical protein
MNFTFHPEPVDEQEDVLGVFYGGRGQVGQKYVVTNRRMLMGPLDTGIALDIDAYALGHAIPGGGDLLKNVLSHYAPMNPATIWLRHVQSVNATNNAGWFKSAGLRIVTDTDDIYNITIVATPTTMNKSSKNNDVRDRAVALISEAVRLAKAASPQGQAH